jgi:PAS domain S-box-containing protein
MDSPIEITDRLLQQQLRTAGRVVAAAVATLMLGWYALHGFARPGVHLVQAANLLVLIPYLWILARPLSHRRMLATAMLAYAATGLAIGACGILARDSSTAIVALLGMALGSATLLYWGAAAQLLGVVILAAVALAVSYLVVDRPGAYWFQHVGTNLPTFGATVYVAYKLRRQHLESVHHDLERVRRENALRESEQRFRAVFETAGIGIALTDPTGRILQANAALENMLGYPHGDLAAVGYEALTHADEDESSRTALRAAVAGSGPEPFHCVLRHLRRDGGLLWGSLIASVIRDRDGWPRYCLILVEDVTEQRRAQQEIQALNETLGRRAAELETSNRELEAFAYSVSHDLRAPLRAIDGFSKALLDEFADKLGGEGQRYLERVRAGAGRMDQLIRDFLELARVTRAEMRHERVDLSQLARNVSAELQRQEPARDVDVHIRDGLLASGDPRLLRAVFENLLSNAWKFTRRRRRARIDVDAEERGGETIFIVRDDGAGFDMRYAGGLFRPFHRVHEAPDFEGSGIGLATAERIVSRHGGRIWAEAAVEKGATFYFTLQPEQPKAARPAPAVR